MLHLGELLITRFKRRSPCAIMSSGTETTLVAEGSSTSLSTTLSIHPEPCMPSCVLVARRRIATAAPASCSNQTTKAKLKSRSKRATMGGRLGSEPCPAMSKDPQDRCCHHAIPHQEMTNVWWYTHRSRLTRMMVSKRWQRLM